MEPGSRLGGQAHPSLPRGPPSRLLPGGGGWRGAGSRACTQSSSGHDQAVAASAQSLLQPGVAHPPSLRGEQRPLSPGSAEAASPTSAPGLLPTSLLLLLEFLKGPLSTIVCQLCVPYLVPHWPSLSLGSLSAPTPLGTPQPLPSFISLIACITLQSAATLAITHNRTDCVPPGTHAATVRAGCPLLISFGWPAGPAALRALPLLPCTARGARRGSGSLREVSEGVGLSLRSGSAVGGPAVC